jgi:hypothetical protein
VQERDLLDVAHGVPGQVEGAGHADGQGDDLAGVLARVEVARLERTEQGADAGVADGLALGAVVLGVVLDEVCSGRRRRG